MDSYGTPPGAAPQARCALHLDAAAVRTCERCGAFMCGTCTRGEPPGQCPVCRGRAVRFAMRRDAWTFSELFDRTVEAFKADWLMLSLAGLVFFAVSMAGGMLAQLGVFAGTVLESTTVTIVAVGVGYLASIFLQGLAAVGLFRIAFDVLQGRRADLARFASQAYKAPRFFGMLLLFIGVFLVLFAAVGAVGFGLYAATRSEAVALGTGFAILLPVSIYVGLPLYFAPAELALEDVGPLEAVRRAWAVIDGHRGWAFLVLLLGGAFAVAGMCACFVGIFPAYALLHLLMAGLYLALRRGSSVQPV